MLLRRAAASSRSHQQLRRSCLHCSRAAAGGGPTSRHVDHVPRRRTGAGDQIRAELKAVREQGGNGGGAPTKSSRIKVPFPRPATVFSLPVLASGLWAASLLPRVTASPWPVHCLSPSVFLPRIKGAMMGALVADALCLGTHYEYDAVRIQKFYGRSGTVFHCPCSVLSLPFAVHSPYSHCLVPG